MRQVNSKELTNANHVELTKDSIVIQYIYAITMKINSSNRQS